MLEKLMETLRMTLETYHKFSGSSLVLLLFLAALFYLWLQEEDLGIRQVFLYITGTILALFFFPVFAYLAIHYFLDEEVYYRFLWLLPMGSIVCYAVVKLLGGIKNPKRKLAFGTVAALFLMLQGSLIYGNQSVTRAENQYHLPEAAVAVAEAVRVEGEWVKAVVPSELIQFIRQYDAKIMMPYGREMLIDRWEMNHELFVAMESEPVHAEYVALLCRENQVEYVVLRENAQIGGRFEDYGFEKLKNAEGYDIYMDINSAFYTEKAEELK